MLKTLVFWSLFRLRKMSFQIIHDQKQNCEDLKMTPENIFYKICFHKSQIEYLFSPPKRSVGTSKQMRYNLTSPH